MNDTTPLCPERRTTMRLVPLCTAGVSGAVIALAIVAITAAQVPSSSPPQSQNGPPTLEDLRRAVSSLRGGRIQRPASYDQMTTAQKAFVNNILSGPRRGIDGSLGIMLVSPTLGDLSQKAIAYARFAGTEGYSSLPPRLNELAILIAARTWTAQYAWNAHQRAALAAGLSADTVDAVKVGKRPASMAKDEETVYNFCTELLTTKQVSDGTFQAARTVLGGDRGIVDLVGTLGLYQFVGMLMSVDRLPLPPGVAPALPPLN
jgi:4-carboxymuconolactone decarboxylase